MNIFFLSRLIEECAKYHADVHVVKMILETAQLLFSAHHFMKTEFKDVPIKIFKLTHQNHPCALWVRASIQNYQWLSQLGLALCKEYTYRYEKKHSCEEVLEWLVKNVPSLPDKNFTDPPQAMPIEFQTKDCVIAYRQYYVNVKSQLTRFNYKNRELPPWWNQIKIIELEKAVIEEKIQCKGITKKGQPCQLKSRSEFCHHHIKL